MTFFTTGFELIDDYIDFEQVDILNKDIDSVPLAPNAGGIRNAEEKISAINKLVYSKALRNSAKHYLQDSAVLVRVILFDKTPDNNWLVTWHQDRTIVVKEKFEREGWGPWSIKDGVHHVQPPIEVLDKMVTFRLHLDDSNEQNGCLKILPKSHQAGILSQEEIRQYTKKHQHVICSAKKGSLLIMRPHILHASSKAIKPTRRRVLHIEFSCRAY